MHTDLHSLKKGCAENLDEPSGAEITSVRPAPVPASSAPYRMGLSVQPAISNTIDNNTDVNQNSELHRLWRPLGGTTRHFLSLW